MIAAETLQQALAQAWHEDTAKNSVDRWLKLCEQEDWGDKPANFPLLVQIFGASWYFSRYIFVSGATAADLIDNSNPPTFDKAGFIAALQPALDEDDFEYRVNRLRILKNNCMLQILIAYLQEAIDLEKLEQALTYLAEAILEQLIKAMQILPQHQQFPITILGMGRMAGYEMTFGSDLDLIFLYESEGQQSYTDMGRTIRLLLRTIAQPASAGALYEVDMRLRPHGNSGTLVTAYNTFIEHHSGDRDIWEKQMMTRCRAILTGSHNVEPVLTEVNNHIYMTYDREFLLQEIVAMRMRVQKELGSPKGKYEIKRGYGGIMDLDFISHYFQLAYGHDKPELQTASTREAFRVMAKLELIDVDTRDKLLEHYNYLKRAEMNLRLFDLKSVDSFTSVEEENMALSRSMGHGNNTRQFLEEYESVTHSVRSHFLKLLVTSYK